jgi:hypothetical protein
MDNEHAGTPVIPGTVDQTEWKALEERGWKVEERFAEKLLEAKVSSRCRQAAKDVGLK